MKNLKNKKGFTIVELVIVIAVIAILAAVLIPTFSGVIAKANASAAQQAAVNVYKEVIAEDLANDGLINDTFAAGYTRPTTVTTYTPAASGDKLTAFAYTDANGYVATLNPATGEWTVAKP